jgi:hypothetical protein
MLIMDGFVRTVASRTSRICSRKCTFARRKVSSQSRFALSFHVVNKYHVPHTPHPQRPPADTVICQRRRRNSKIGGIIFTSKVLNRAVSLLPSTAEAEILSLRFTGGRTTEIDH